MIVSAGFRKHGFDAYGDTFLKKEDMAYWLDQPIISDPQGVALGLDEEIEEVEPDFFEVLPTINELWINNPECLIHMTDKTIQQFRNNNILLRGIYDSNAEKLASDHHLRFLHLDLEIARKGDYFEHGSDRITLRFRNDGTVYIHQDCLTQGISAGSMGGGETSFDIPADFYRSMKPEEVADMCWDRCYSEILNNGTLSSFMEKARAKNGFLLDFRK